MGRDVSMMVLVVFNSKSETGMFYKALWDYLAGIHKQVIVSDSETMIFCDGVEIRCMNVPQAIDNSAGRKYNSVWRGSGVPSDVKPFFKNKIKDPKDIPIWLQACFVYYDLERV